MFFFPWFFTFECMGGNVAVCIIVICRFVFCLRMFRLLDRCVVRLFWMRFFIPNAVFAAAFLALSLYPIELNTLSIWRLCTRETFSNLTFFLYLFHQIWLLMGQHSIRNCNISFQLYQLFRCIHMHTHTQFSFLCWSFGLFSSFPSIPGLVMYGKYLSTVILDTIQRPSRLHFVYHRTFANTHTKQSHPQHSK